MEEFSLTKLTRSIEAKCKECLYDSGSLGTWKQQVALCTARKCPLYSVRPLPASLPLKIIKHYGMTLRDLDSRAKEV